MKDSETYRVAIPVANGRLSKYFGQCESYEVYDIKDGKIIGNQTLIPDIERIEDLPNWASGHAITDVVAHRISKSILHLFSIHKITLFVGIQTDDPAQIIASFIREELVSDNQVINEIINL